MYNILDYGAVSDGKTLNSKAIQAAIDDCHKNGGGRVCVPGGTFKTGTIWLKSNVELHLSSGAVLLASDNMDDYNTLDAYEQNFGCPSEKWTGAHLIIAHEAQNVAITGFGTVDGNCYAFVEDDYNEEKWFKWRAGSFRIKDPVRLRPGQLIVFVECKHVNIRDFTVRDSGCWSIFFHGCEYVSVIGYKAFNPINMINSDGMDIDCCRNVVVSDCIIHSGDDGITIRCDEKPLKNKDVHSEYITITNCVIHASICAFRFGVGEGTIKHVQISNIAVSRSRELMHFCTAYLNNGCARIEDLHIRGISAQDTDRAISMFAANGAYVKDVTIENIRSTGCSMSYIEVRNGIIENIRLRNFEINAFDRYEYFDEKHLGMRGHHIFCVKGVKNLTMEDVRVNGDFKQRKERIVLEDCENLAERNCDFGLLM